MEKDIDQNINSKIGSIKKIDIDYSIRYILKIK